MIQYQSISEFFQQQETVTKVIIRLTDCDILQHLKNSNYFDYFFNAREEELETLYNRSILNFFVEDKKAWVVYNQQIHYLKPAKMKESVIITSNTIQFDSKNLIIEYLMFNEAKTQLKTLLWTHFRCVSIIDGTSTTHPPGLLEILEKRFLKYPFIELNINKRLVQLKELFKK
ncbi:MAG: acyl-CoA thioesterase [Chitinophagaceae bacterium]|nr:acyl-CoA thioesterase [Chitinophagaceae bacterium]